jgi:pantoate--beta-alanine ligase
MDTLTRSASVRDRVRVWRDSGQKIALVPTMGTLHKGHMSLVAEAEERADHVIVSIFADAQPRATHTLEADRELLTKVGADLLFMPPVQEIFPIGRELSAVVSLPTLSGVLEGASRPDYFATATTVLVKLFNIVRPDIAVFGERDFQQLVIVRRLVDDLFLPVDIIAAPIFRDSDGLAFASGNRDLTPEERAVAPRLYAVLAEVAAKIDLGERDYAALEDFALEALPASGFVPDYVAIRQAADLAPIGAAARDLVILGAARLGRNRLADNLKVRLIDRF